MRLGSKDTISLSEGVGATMKEKNHHHSSLTVITASQQSVERVKVVNQVDLK